MEHSPHNLAATSGTLTRVRVIPLTQGKKENQKTPLLFYGPLRCLIMDPKWFQWKDGSPLQDYSAKKGRTFLRDRAPEWDLATQKWPGQLPPRYNFRWEKLWIKTRAQKESTLIWLIWHKGVAINKWRKMINVELDGNCCFCVPLVEESILHRFWECPHSRRVWEWAWSVLHKMRTRRSHPGPWEAFHWKQVILEEALPRKVKRFQSIWILLKGACMWTIWIQRNAMVFDQLLWTDRQAEQIAWLAMIEYGEIAWKHTLKMLAKQPELEQQFLNQFDRSWLSRKVFGTRTQLTVAWKKQPPHRSMIFQLPLDL